MWEVVEAGAYAPPLAAAVLAKPRRMIHLCLTCHEHPGSRFWLSPFCFLLEEVDAFELMMPAMEGHPFGGNDVGLAGDGAAVVVDAVCVCVAATWHML